MSSAEKINARKNALIISQEIISGKIGLLLGVRKLLPNLFVLGLDHHQDFIIFKGVDSQEDHLPVGPERQGWSQEALDSKNLEIEVAENFHREVIFEGCRALIKYIENPAKSVSTQITFLNGSDVCRGEIPTVGYAPHLSTKADEMLGVRLKRIEVHSKFDSPIKAEFELLYDGVEYGSLVPGAKFKILEGSKTVGFGTVLEDQ